MPASLDRRSFLTRGSASLTAGLLSTGYFISPSAAQESSSSANQQLGIGSIGLRYQGSVISVKAQAHGQCVALADVDRHVLEQGRAAFGSTPKIYDDYRDLLENKAVDVVTIGSPDHWHAKMLIDACRAGKDVYCEKPLTLTIAEGQAIAKVVKETGRVVQVGSWQRSDHRFRLAVELVRQGRIGKLQRVDVVLGKNKTSGSLEVRKVPAHFNWDMWQGQTPEVPYIPQRAHYTFRWWQEYSGGQMTDWGAHHLDIAQWAINSTPVKILGVAKYPHVENAFNVPIDFQATYQYENGVEMTVSDTGRNGILFTGSEGRLFVNRGTISGKPVEDLKQRPLEREQFISYKNDNLSRPTRVGKLDAIINHMGNFFDCIATRKLPVSDVYSQHQSVTSCHLANISMKLGRAVNWDAKTESFPDDPQANELKSREQRSGYEVV